MTTKPKQRCILCRSLSAGLYCTTCRPKRQSANERGYDADWRKVRDHKLAIDPLCEVCLDEGRPTPASVVHHDRPIRTHPELRLVLSNLVSCCDACHREIEKERAAMPMHRWERRTNRS